MQISTWVLCFALVMSLIACVLGISSLKSVKKFAYVESGIILENYAGAQAARSKLAEKTREWQENIKKLQNGLTELDQEIVQKNKTWDKRTKLDKQNEFAEKKKELIRYTNAINDKAMQLEQELMKPVFTELNEYFEMFGRERGYDIILGTVSGGSILHGDETVNLTHQVLRYIEERGR